MFAAAQERSERWDEVDFLWRWTIIVSYIDWYKIEEPESEK